MKLILIKIVIGFCCIFCFSLSSLVAGQCITKSTNYQLKVFEEVTSKEIKEQIISRFNQFVGYYCNHDFTNAYKMLSTEYLGSIRKPSGKEISEQDWINDRFEFYSGEKTRFLSFTPKEVSEYAEDNRQAVRWRVWGCLAEVLNGKKR